MNTTNAHRLVVLLLNGLLPACSTLRQCDETTQLNQVFNIPPHQGVYAYVRRGGVLTKTITQPAKAALYERQDTLFAEFLAESLPPPDGDRPTLDQSDSLAVFFLHYNPTLKKLEEKSPWFRYQSAAFDVDLFTLPFKYRFPTGGQPGQLEDKLNVGIHAGYRYDLGKYRTVYFRRNQHSEISSFSVGLGGFLCFAPAPVTAFNTGGAGAGPISGTGYQLRCIQHGELRLVLGRAGAGLRAAGQ